MASLDRNERFELIKENLAEVLNPEIIESILVDGRSPKIYWGEYFPSTAVSITLILPTVRYRDDRPSSLRIFCPCDQTWTVPTSRM